MELILVDVLLTDTTYIEINPGMIVSWKWQDRTDTFNSEATITMITGTTYTLPPISANFLRAFTRFSPYDPRGTVLRNDPNGLLP